MSDVSWPAWMPAPPDAKCGFGAPRLDMECGECLDALLAWYAEAKRRDPDFGHVTAPIDALRQRMTVVPRTPNYIPLDVDFEAAKRAAFPLPEDGPTLPTMDGLAPSTAPKPWEEPDGA